ncbi:MAG: hypothetical protein KAI47_16710 [Deltaproteobacteria bacterium]|nr:hypothetical protein [Deltaproteobacteria bacterium]
MPKVLVISLLTVVFLGPGCSRFGFQGNDARVPDVSYDASSDVSRDLRAKPDVYVIPQVRFPTATQTISEGVGTVALVLELSHKATQDVTVPFTVSGTAKSPDDHDLVAGTITIFAGDTTGQIDIHVVDDSWLEPVERIIVTMGTPQHTAKGSPASLTLTISANDTNYCSGTALTHAPYAGGDGSANNPYTICTSKQLLAIGTANMDKQFRLMAAIDLSGTPGNHQPIGSTTVPFAGTFDGNNHEISGFRYKDAKASNIGLFARINQGIVKDLTVGEVDVLGNDYVGALAGRSSGTITNCKTSGLVEASGNYGGGLLGYVLNGGTISGSSSSAAVIAQIAYAGGLVAQNSGSITGSWASGKVDAPRLGGCAYGGGLVGRNMGTITACYATGEVTAGGGVGGGLVGWNTGTVSDCYARGAVSVKQAGPTGTCTTLGSSSYGGGLVGVNMGSGLVRRSYATGEVMADGGENGGLVGLTFGTGAKTAQSFSVGKTTSPTPVGGLIGKVYKGSESGSYWDTFTSGWNVMCGEGSALSGCDNNHGIDTAQPATANYFFDKTKPPLDSWDFVAIWVEHATTYPTFAKKQPAQP